MTDDLVNELSRAISLMRAHVVWPSVDVAIKVEVQIDKALAAIQRALKPTPFTRADGTTSPVRTGEVDRRKSAHGDLDVGIERADGFTRGPSLIRYGRRFGDRERWTGEKARVSFEKAHIDERGYVDFTREQEATPQPEQPSLEKDRRPARVIDGKHEKVAREAAQLFVDAVMDHVNAMLDRRLAALGE